MTKTEELREELYEILSSFASTSDWVGQILHACQKVGLAFVVEDAKVPERRKRRTFGVESVTDALAKSDIYLQGEIDAQQDMLDDHWEKTKKIELA